MPNIKTELLNISYEIHGPSDGHPVMLLHGWPDDASAWKAVVPLLNKAGLRTIVPFLRGFGATEFLAPDTLRDGRGVALVQDALDLADRLNIGRFAVVGHDWGGRAAYFLGSAFPDRVTHVAALAIPYQPGGAFAVPSFTQSQRIWYQWFMCIAGGVEAIRNDPKGFARMQWETWSPSGWFTNQQFDEAATSFDNPDWLAVTLHGYRSRYLDEPSDDRYVHILERLVAAKASKVNTLLIHGLSDACDPPERFRGQSELFAGKYRSVALQGVGHFPAREAPQEVADALIRQLNEQG